MAYKNNLLEYYGGGSVPYRQCYQGGGPAEEEKSFAESLFYDPKIKSYFTRNKSVPSGEMEVSSMLSRIVDDKGDWGRRTVSTRHSEKGSPYEGLKEHHILEGGRGRDSIDKYFLETDLGRYQGWPEQRKIENTAEADSIWNVYGLQKGGSVGNSLLGMQYGGYTGGGALGNLGRLRSIMKATKDVQSRAKQIKSKKSKAGFFGKLLGKGFDWGTKALLGSTLGPLGLLAAQTIGSGIGGYLGAKLGYGKKVGTGLDESKWLAGDREKLGKAEGNLEDLYKDIAGKQASATAKSGGTKFLKEAGAKTWGDYAEAKFSKGKWSGKELTPFNEEAAAAYAKAKKAMPFDPRDESLVGGLEGYRSQMVEGMKDYDLNPSLGGLNIPSMGDPTAGSDPFQYARSGLGAQAGQRGVFGGLSSLAQGETNFLQQQPWAQAGYQLPEQSLGEDLITGQYSPWSNITSGAYAGPIRQQQGGIVRDDRALIDMLYRR
jgi:hypothetical protein